MATTTKTGTFTCKITGYTSVTVDYSITTSETTVTFAISRLSWKNTRTSGLPHKSSWDFIFASSSLSWSTSGTASAGSKTWSKSVSWTKSWTRTHSNASVDTPYTAGLHDDVAGTGYAAGGYGPTVSIPARLSYKVTLNANGGSGGTASLTKWYNEPLPLTSGVTAPTRAGYRFIGWATSTANADAGTTISSYDANSTTTLYAAWKPIISGIGMNIHTLRVDEVGDTEESDEGQVCYGIIEYAMVGAATASSTFDITAPSGVVFEGHVPGEDNHLAVTKTKTTAEDIYSSFTFYATGCDTEENYRFAASMVTSNTEWASQETLSLNKADVLSAAYFPMDFLGDAYYYSLTEDTAIDPAKVYYTREGDGSAQNPYEYTRVETPDVADIDKYYEANGEKPGHGISFGAPSKHEGFNVSMPQFAYERRAYPLYVYSTAPDESDLPVTPCFVLATDDYGLWYYDGN